MLVLAFVCLSALWINSYSFEHHERCQSCVSYRQESEWGIGMGDLRPWIRLGGSRMVEEPSLTFREVFEGRHEHRWAPFGTRMFRGGVFLLPIAHTWNADLTSPIALYYEGVEAFRRSVKGRLQRGEISPKDLRALCELPADASWAKETDPARRALMATGYEFLREAGVPSRGERWREPAAAGR